MSQYVDPEMGIAMDAPKQLLLRMRSVPAYDVSLNFEGWMCVRVRGCRFTVLTVSKGGIYLGFYILAIFFRVQTIILVLFQHPHTALTSMYVYYSIYI